jgi:ABC-type uncharacterized transport system substrate-binding protein
MKMKTTSYYLIILAIFLSCGLCSAKADETKKFKVLVVMSYEEDFPWDKEIKQGIESVLSGNSEIRYVYLNTRHNDSETGKTKAKEAYALYQEFKPDGVIAADDNAQSLFVVPYLKDKVKTPIMFNGVNAEPNEYGYPTSHISGILERVHYIESIAFIQQLVPSVKSVGYIWGNNATAKGFYQQVQQEMNTYSAKSVAFRFVETLDDAVKKAEELKPQCDAIFIDLVRGIKDKDGKPLDESAAVPVLVKAFGKPVLTANSYMMKYGALCAVVKTGQEQGQTSAKMLMKAMQGTPVSQIPITKNHNGKRMINATALKAFGIKPDISILQGAEIVKTEE